MLPSTPSPRTLAAQFCAELSHIHAFITAQETVTDITSLRAGQCTNIVARIRCLQVLSPQDATTITSLVGTGPWTVDQKKDLASAVQDRLTGGDPALSSPDQHKKRRNNQTLSSFEQYLTDRDITLIQDPANRTLTCNIHVKHQQTCW
jgi:hypothetical protein